MGSRSALSPDPFQFLSVGSLKQLANSAEFPTETFHSF